MVEHSDDVTVWLEKLDLPQYIKKFLAAGYSSLKQCLTLSKADLSTIGVTKIGHVTRMFRDLERIKADGELESSSLPIPMSLLNMSLNNGGNAQVSLRTFSVH